MTILTSVNKKYVQTRDKKAKHCLKCGKVITYGVNNKSGYCYACLNIYRTKKNTKLRRHFCKAESNTCKNQVGDLCKLINPCGVNCGSWDKFKVEKTKEMGE